MKQKTMRWMVAVVGVMGICTAAGFAGAETAIASASNYMNNRPPLRANPYVPLPVGAIRPEGWLREQLGRMQTGLTGNLDTRYSQVVGPRNGWLGGDGDSWERGLYWIDGLLPLAYILNDPALIEKVRPWVEWTLTHQRDDGYLGPERFKERPKDEPGIQKEPREDWWPRMVMLKILQQYYEATQDERVIAVLTKYFRYQLKQLPEYHLDHWSFWANRRGADNLMVVYWLYNKTGDAFLLELAELIYQQTFPYTEIFLNPYDNPQDNLAHIYPNTISNRYPFNRELIARMHVGQLQSFHCVNLAQGLKTPVIYYQQHPEEKYLTATRNALRDIRLFHGQPQGMYGGDEPMHGNNPTQGIEFCSVVEMMFSLESMLTITGDTQLADHLEKVAFNALPTQATDDFKYRQYFQTANQVKVSRGKRNFYEDESHGGTDSCFGLLTGYPCCTCNMHQGWPKFVQNLWYGTAEGGLAALVYGACEVTAKVAEGIPVRIVEQTDYPFEESIRFTVYAKDKVTFPLHLRVPAWCRDAKVLINQEVWGKVAAGQIAKISREWKNKDTVELELPMEVGTSRWVENSVAVERGPLVYVLKIEEDWKFVEGRDHFGEYYEVYPKSPWNYGLLDGVVNNPAKGFVVQKKDKVSGYPWNLENAPIELKTRGKMVPEWQLYNEMAGPLPHSLPQSHLRGKPAQDITLIPYGCSTLRITEFPVVQ
jgi:hypothetical protein